MLDMPVEVTEWTDTAARDSYRHKIAVLNELTELYPDYTESDLEILCSELHYDKEDVIQTLEGENFLGFWFWDDFKEQQLYERFERHMSEEVWENLKPLINMQEFGELIESEFFIISRYNKDRLAIFNY